MLLQYTVYFLNALTIPCVLTECCSHEMTLLEQRKAGRSTTRRVTMDACTESPAEVKAFALVHISEKHNSTIVVSVVKIFPF